MPFTFFGVSQHGERNCSLVAEGLSNTVNGITVLRYVGGQVAALTRPHSEVSKPWRVKIPQGEKYRRN